MLLDSKVLDILDVRSLSRETAIDDDDGRHDGGDGGRRVIIRTVS
jgi:hypothetical protein